MPQLGTLRNSGNVPHSTFRLTINGYTYIVRNVTPTQGDRTAYANDEYGTEGGAGFVQFGGLKRGSLDLQFTTTASLLAMPTAGDLIIIPAGNASGSAFSASIQNPSNPRTAGEVWTLTCDYIELSQGNS